MCLLKVVIATSFNVSGRLANERILHTHVLGCEAVSGRSGGEGVIWP